MPGVLLLWRNATGMEHIRGVGHAIYGNEGPTTSEPLRKVFGELGILASPMNNIPHWQSTLSVFKTAPCVWINMSCVGP